MFMSVVLPAPFSPSIPRTLPRSAEIEIRSLARTPGNRFVMSRSSSRIRCWPSAVDGNRPRPAGRVGGDRRYWLMAPTGRLAAWDAPGCRGVGSADEGADLDGAVDERGLEGSDLVLGRLRDLTVVIVERGQEHAVVGERAAVVLAAE